MLQCDREMFYKNFSYRYIKGPQSPPAQVHSLGWQIQNSTEYNFDGMRRPDEAGNCIFQYTLSGAGVIEFDNERYILDEGSAFLSTIPSKHRYYIPKNGQKWEFIYITLTGEYTISEWRKIQDNFGAVVKFSEKEEVIKYLWQIYWDAVNNKITDGYQTSGKAYEFIMKLYTSLNAQATKDMPNNNTLHEAITFMKDNLHRELCLDDIAFEVNMSKFHFNHLFTKAMGISAWNYITKLRIEKAVELLVSTSFTVEEIASMVGYSSSNYFNKVFRKYMGTSPGRLRKTYKDVRDITVSL
ncbi:AraC family transcriptional regulator [Clostridium swellfunianum]|uniref:AraC family transcriptional regulator n=1 Tax=Clostridium swellfunianum TaxID=1367462 RepID=UPI00202EE8AE|nr:helix-turn-helix domain-containing protein [Clostridium swellfunianum]MCM0647319.1 AraC family transcriptional regulator [Clostridium swellfunianum]